MLVCVVVLRDCVCLCVLVCLFGLCCVVLLCFCRFFVRVGLFCVVLFVVCVRLLFVYGLGMFFV